MARTPTERPPTHPGEMLFEEFLKPNGYNSEGIGPGPGCAVSADQ